MLPVFLGRFLIERLHPPKSYYAASSWRGWWPWVEWAMYVWSFFSWQGHPRREGHSIISSKNIKAMDKVRLLPLGLVPTEAARSSFTMNRSPIVSFAMDPLELELFENPALVRDFLWASGLLDFV
ncbi:hypothetical protein AVEN_227101-1 [Araneus ventricosus]|uniref:Uncharacterized protein n=1 Tax=Araneus ventricosus TaxID=182803 RepID=A0A4Y2BVR1_ARAVE|nr:hypothetical protein AVEN_227101-1 [Araneus ventricosus]